MRSLGASGNYDSYIHALLKVRERVTRPVGQGAQCTYAQTSSGERLLYRMLGHFLGIGSTPSPSRIISGCALNGRIHIREICILHGAQSHAC